MRLCNKLARINCLFTRFCPGKIFAYWCQAAILLLWTQLRGLRDRYCEQTFTTRLYGCRCQGAGPDHKAPSAPCIEVVDRDFVAQYLRHLAS